MRAFPVVYSRDVRRAAAFYALLGFEQRYQFPLEGEPGYVSLGRDESAVGIVHESSPQRMIGARMGDGPRFEMFVYVEDVDAALAQLCANDVPVLREPEDMPWGERIAIVADPDGNP